MKKRAKVVAFYLPQYHPISENDAWWGEGYTEWDKVSRAKKLFRKHDQPKIPGELGYYDLRVPSVREQQADLARDHGLEAFMYWDYWFGNGVRLLDRPLNEMLRLRKPDFPFCLAWANHTWYKKTGGPISSVGKPLIVQQYPGPTDYTAHFMALRDAFEDERYYKMKGKLLFAIFAPHRHPDMPGFLDAWRELADKAGLPGFHFVAINRHLNKNSKLRKQGFDGINPVLHNVWTKFPGWKNTYWNLNRKLLKRPIMVSYKKVIPQLSHSIHRERDVYPNVVPNWDHTPRSGKFGHLFQDCTPELFDRHLKQVLRDVGHKNEEEQLVFLKSWNEWSEGNYVEPDRKFGRERLIVLKNNIFVN
jgi:hypothetical protein